MTATDDRIAELEQRVDRLTSRQEILDLYVRYMRGVDRLDEHLHNDSYWPDVVLDYGPGSWATIDEMWQTHATAFPANALISWAHLITNQSVEIHGDRAEVETYVTGLGVAPDGDERLNAIWAGRYVDRVERREGVWRIAARRFHPHFAMKGETDRSFVSAS